MNLAIHTASRGPQPPRLVIYGPPGVGKSTWAAGAPSPVFLPVEDGLGNLDVPAITDAGKRTLTSLDEVHGAIDLLDGQHGYKTLVLDSCTALQELVFQAVAEENGAKTIADVSYGRGYPQALTLWCRLLQRLDTLRDQRGMAIVVIGHSQVEPYADPEGEAYDRFVLRLHQQREGKPSLRATTVEWADAVLFGNFRAYRREAGEGFNKRTIAGGSGERILYTSPHPARVAKNRYGLPSELPLTWGDFFAAFQAAHQTQTNDTN